MTSMFRYSIIFLIFSFIICFSGTDCIAEKQIKCAACDKFNELNTRIRDGEVNRNEAEVEIRQIIPLISRYYYDNGGIDYGKDSWVFPVEGYSAKMKGVIVRGDYMPEGYDYFDGNRHGGHPSYDIFIRDKNYDAIDDMTGKPVNILSLTGGIVVAVEKDWNPGSTLRGGKYIWIYDPANEALIYYAHNRSIFVKPGDMVKPGDRIAGMGRTGSKANRTDIPTHLHLTFLRVAERYPRPFNIYGDLKRIRTVIKE
jgi:murein DD-endopeptidase MepM/ murein hydrolase activator NlpD